MRIVIIAAAVLALPLTTNAGGFHGGGCGGGFHGGWVGGGCYRGGYSMAAAGAWAWAGGCGLGRFCWPRRAGLLRRLRVLRLRPGLRRARLCRAGLRHARLHHPAYTLRRFTRHRLTTAAVYARTPAYVPARTTTYAAPAYAAAVRPAAPAVARHLHPGPNRQAWTPQPVRQAVRLTTGRRRRARPPTTPPPGSSEGVVLPSSCGFWRASVPASPASQQRGLAGTLGLPMQLLRFEPWRLDPIFQAWTRAR